MRASVLTPLQCRSLAALRLLRAGPCTHADLVARLCIGRRSVQQCLQSLRSNGFSIETRTEGRRRLFWTSAQTNCLPAALSPEEKAALAGLLTHANPQVQSAIYKLIQLTTS